jgi:putative hydrolase of the HAD superfamily
VTVKAVFFDALGTLVRLEPPAPRLAAALGIEPGPRVDSAMRAEMSYYRDHAHEARDAEALGALRAECAALLSRELGAEVGVDTMMGAIGFRAYDDSAPALARAGELGLRRVCVSNWDYALGEVLDRCGLADLLDGVVTSAAVGARKPDPAIFRAALALAGCEPAEAVHVGDTPAEDVDGARAAGVRAVLIDREGGGAIASLAEIEQLLRP